MSACLLRMSLPRMLGIRRILSFSWACFRMQRHSSVSWCVFLSSRWNVSLASLRMYVSTVPPMPSMPLASFSSTS